DRSEQPRAKAEGIGVFGDDVSIAAEADAADERIGAQIFGEAVEVDLFRIRARTLLQEHVARLNEAETPSLRPIAAARIKRRARREESGGHRLWLLSEGQDH